MSRRPSVPEVVPSSSIPKHGEVANVSGNHFDKHGSQNPIFRGIMARFHADILSAVTSFSPQSVLDAGCGEGRTTTVVHKSVQTTVGVELERDALVAAPRDVDGLAFVAGSVYDLPFDDDSFDVVLCTEVLEHLTDPASALSELVRVARSGVVLTVPREPWWRIANLARGAYVLRLGNTPGHVQHFTKRKLRALVTSTIGVSALDLGASTMWRVARISL